MPRGSLLSSSAARDGRRSSPPAACARRSVVVKLPGAGELLRQRAPALHDPAGAGVGPRSGDDADRVEPSVTEESAILDGEQRMDHTRRDPLEGNVDPLLGEKGECRAAMTVEYDRRLGPRPELREWCGVLELGSHVPGEDRRSAGRGKKHSRHDNERSQQESLPTCHPNEWSNASASRGSTRLNTVQHCSRLAISHVTAQPFGSSRTPEHQHLSAPFSTLQHPSAPLKHP
jgi:hypothetical protein